MNEDRVVEFKTPVEGEDLLTELLRVGSRKLIAAAVGAEFSELLSQYSGCVDEGGRRAVVRNGYLPEREVQTGIGPVRVRVPKAKVVISERFNDKQQVFLDFVLSHYVRVGVDELDQEKLTPLLKLKYQDSIADAVADLGDAGEIGKIFAGFQKFLYQEVA